MRMYVTLAAFLFCCGIAISADETAFHFEFHNAGNEYRTLNSVPVFEKLFENVTVDENETFQVFCSADGEPTITYEWLDPNENKISSDGNKTVVAVPSDNGSWLFISNVSNSDAGLYTCTAANEHGLSSRFFNIIVIVRDSNGDSDDNGTTSIVKLQANVKNNSISFKIYTVGKVHTIFVQYSEMRSPAIKNRLQWKFGGVGPYEIKNLTPSGKYNFQFKLSVDDEWSNYTIVMLPEIPQVIFGGLNDGTLRIEWFTSLDNKMRGTIDKHELSYYIVTQDQGNYWKKDDCAVTIEIPTCSTDSYTITSLRKNVYYEIRLRAHTSEGYGEPYYHKIHT